MTHDEADVRDAAADAAGDGGDGGAAAVSGSRHSAHTQIFLPGVRGVQHHPHQRRHGGEQVGGREQEGEVENTILASERTPVETGYIDRYYYCIKGDVYMSVYKYLSLFARLLTEIFRTLVEEKLHYRVEILEAEGEQQLPGHNVSETADTDNATLCLDPGCVDMQCLKRRLCECSRRFHNHGEGPY